MSGSFARAERRRVARHDAKNPNGPKRWINLVEYVKDRVRCTSGDAKRVVMFGALSVDGKPVGFEHIDGRRFISPLIPAADKDRIVIQSIMLEALKEMEAKEAA